MKLAFKMFVRPNCQSGGGTISHGPPGREKRSGRTVSHWGPFCMEHRCSVRKLFLQLLTRNRDKLGLVLKPRGGLEERDDISSFSPPFKCYIA